MSGLIWREDGTRQADIVVPHGELARLGAALTVSAWVHSSGSQAEAMQPLVSKWAPHSSFDTFSAFDAGLTDGLTTKGFYGAVFDGQYIYYCPIRSREDRTSVHGYVLRYDTHVDFDTARAYSAYDAGHTDGMQTAGFYGGAFDGRYIYCCPGYTNPTHAPFADATQSGVVMRLDTAGGFRDPASYRTFDARSVDPEAVCFDGAAFDGRYVYFVPLHANTALRYDTRAGFDELDSWLSYDAGGAVGLGPSVGAVFDGINLYFVPFGHSTMVRYNTRGTFTERDEWAAFDAAAIPGLEPAGFKGGFFDGRYVYYVPFRGDVPAGSDKSPFHGNYVRYDTTLPYADPTSWIACDAGFTDGLHTTAFTAGASDGRYLYAAPWRGDRDGGQMHGRILRYDTVGDNGSFSLRYVG